MKDFSNYSLLAHNTFGIDAYCSRYIEYETVEEARQVAAILRGGKVPFLIIGGGSNLLLTRDFDGIVVRAAILGKEVSDDTTEKCLSATAKGEGFSLLCCGAGEVWDDVVAFCVDHGLYGAENLSLIPGDVGASAVQNIGAYGSEVRELIEQVEAVEIATGAIRHFSPADCEYGYRQSKFKHEWKDRYLITRVTYRLSHTFMPKLEYGNIRSELERKGICQPTAKQLRQIITDIRNANLPDPKVVGNGGSFFMNPVVGKAKYRELAARYPDMPHYSVDENHEKIPAGWMIEQCGWKGKSLGKAGVHDKQALVLVNRGGAAGSDIVRLMKVIQQDVERQFGISICPEVNIV